MTIRAEAAPTAAFAKSVEGAKTAVEAYKAIEVARNVSFGDYTCDGYDIYLFLDHLIHRGDLAMIPGLVTNLDPELVVVGYPVAVTARAKCR